MKLPISLVVLLSLLVSACIGDGLIVLKGRVRDLDGRPVDGCVLELVVKSSGKVVTKRKIQSVFTEAVTVAPMARSYYVTIRCPLGAAGKVEDFTFPSVKSNLEVDLGDVVVK